ncbi:carbohydrate ABC transporter permease [Paenibacillus montanisoli]|uniref:Sugar ABC transporter permease n=1 Tax=Paenibacillus montanisoli TaxID=2081970 RepID=A0A328TYT2_9BACL|nr:sugar ABC transporter permease [Paenibacillus montanisoli]RAP73815.1 sugar ABC transporter permease [Paenibacillus montanisoli]
MASFRLTNKRRKALVGMAFIAPWIIGFFLFALRPMIYALYLSFQKVKVTPLGIKTDYVGWDNYKYAFDTDPHFVEMLLRYLRDMAMNVPIIVTFSLIIAMLINQKIQFRGTFRTIFFLPVIITSGPVINELLSQGVTTIPNIESYAMFELVKESLTPAVADPIMYLFKQIIMVLWFSGVQILIFLAGLQKVDSSLYEAARIDGASPWEAFWKLTLPMLMPLVVVNFVYTIVYVSTFALNEIIVMISKSMFDTLTGFGYATAIAWIYFVMIAIVLAIWTAVLNSRNS